VFEKQAKILLMLVGSLVISWSFLGRLDGSNIRQLNMYYTYH
jgi:hypothetical protein